MTQTDTPHSPLPASQAEYIQWIRLIRSRRVGPATFHRLMRSHGSVEAAIAALPDIAKQAGVKKYMPCPFDTSEAEFLEAQHKGYRPICIGDPDYPVLLAETSDAPPLLWANGDIACLNNQSSPLWGHVMLLALGGA